MSNPKQARLVYDGICNLCTGAVRFLSALDRKHAVEYSPYQALDPEERKRVGLSILDLEGQMHVIRPDGSVAKGAAAIAEICKLLSPSIVLCDLFNTPFAQRLYDFIAGRRYRLFGCRDSCYVPVVAEVGR